MIEEGSSNLLEEGSLRLPLAPPNKESSSSRRFVLLRPDPLPTIGHSNRCATSLTIDRQSMLKKAVSPSHRLSVSDRRCLICGLSARRDAALPPGLRISLYRLDRRSRAQRHAWESMLKEYSGQIPPGNGAICGRHFDGGRPGVHPSASNFTPSMDVKWPCRSADHVYERTATQSASSLEIEGNGAATLDSGSDTRGSLSMVFFLFSAR